MTPAALVGPLTWCALLSSELSEKAKADLMEFEMQDRQRREGRFGGGWGRGGGRGYGRGNLQGFGGQNFRGRGRMNDQRNPLMGHMGMQVKTPRHTGTLTWTCMYTHLEMHVHSPGDACRVPVVR